MTEIEEFDAPLFKILAHNDTGQSVGHQGGIVIPKELDPYFPQLSRSVSAALPTVDQTIVADLFDGARYVGTVESRYQIQTWGGTRSPERRLTGNLGPIRNIAAAGDLILIERGVIDDRRYRLTLIREASRPFQDILPSLDGRRWGPLNRNMPPVQEIEVAQALSEIVNREQAPFTLFEEGAGYAEARTRRVARSRAFQTRILDIYGRRCSVCNSGLAHPNGRCEPQAAHIVPRRLKGSDDVRNGLLLCGSHHWAFDNGLFGVGMDFRIVVSDLIVSMPANATLTGLRGQTINLPKSEEYMPNLEALNWHLTNTLFA
jgi:putative restriction endonuclease